MCAYVCVHAFAPYNNYKSISPQLCPPSGLGSLLHIAHPWHGPPSIGAGPTSLLADLDYFKGNWTEIQANTRKEKEWLYLPRKLDASPCNTEHKIR